MSRQVLRLMARSGDKDAKKLEKSLAVLDLGEATESDIDGALELVGRYVEGKMNQFLLDVQG